MAGVLTYTARTAAAIAFAASLLAGPSAPGQGVLLPPIGQKMTQADRNEEKQLPPPRRMTEKDDKDEPDEGGEKDKKDAATLPMPRQLPAPPGYDLNQLTGLLLERNPRLAQAAYSIDAAAGRAVQAGLYPNPVVSVAGDEIADRTGPVVLNAPQVSQEIVTAGKLGLSKAAAEREIDQAALALISLRFDRIAAVRRSYYEVLTLQRRWEILDELYRLADESLQTSEKLLKAGQAARLDVVQLEVERERFRAEKEATLREILPAFARLAAAVGVSDLPYRPLAGSLDLSLPAYHLGKAREFVARAHPDILSAKQGVARAQLLLDRAKVEPIPNVTVQAGYVYQGQNRSNDFNIGVSLPVPVWNKNQGNIAAAKAQLGEAIQQIGRTEIELAERLAQSFAVYEPAQRRAEVYRRSILPRARESYQLSLKAYQSGQFDYLRVLEAQRALSQADLEYVRSQGEAWRAAGEISGLLLEEQWPVCPPKPVPAPAAKR